jgi:Flp pilus assembly protein TadD
MAQSGEGAVADFGYVPFGMRAANALVSYAGYLLKTVVPYPLAAFYPHPSTLHVGIPAWKTAGALLLLCGITLVAWRERARRPHLATGWLWFLGTLVPVIGLTQVGGQAMADRYTYIPLVGIFIAMAWSLPGMAARPPFGRLSVGAAGLSVALLAAVAWNQAGYWRDSVTLFTHAKTVVDGNWLAWNNLGVAYGGLGLPREAEACYREAARIKPDFAESWNNLALLEAGSGRFDAADAHFREAIRLKPGNDQVWNNLGTLHAEQGRFRMAEGFFREAVRIRPGNLVAWENLGWCYDRLGRPREAADAWRIARRPG